LQKLFPNLHVEEIGELSGLSREELCERINENGIFHATEPGAPGTDVSPTPVNIEATSLDYYPFIGDAGTCNQAQKEWSETTNLGNVVVLPPHAHSLGPLKALSGLDSLPSDPGSMTTFDRPVCTYHADQGAASRKEQAVERITNILDYFMTKADVEFEMGTPQETRWLPFNEEM
jgi:hypothetical protein